MRRIKVIVAMAVVGALVLAGGAYGAKRYLISNVNQIKPSVRAQLKGIGALHTFKVFGSTATLCDSGSCDVGGSVASCPSGSILTGGGWDGQSLPPLFTGIGYNDPSGNGWEVVMGSTDTSGLTQTFRAVAICEATGLTAKDVAVSHPTADQSTRLTADVAKVRARR